MMGYKTKCESCDMKIGMSHRYCPHCGVEQQHAAEVIEEIRAK